MKVLTWRVGEVGMEGTRWVRPDGTFTIGKRVYTNERLKEHVGEMIRFHDDDCLRGTIAVWLAVDNGPKKAPMTGKWLCRAHEVKDDN
jgi:hypothetical protein